MKLHVHVRREWGFRYNQVIKFHCDRLTSHRKNIPDHICRYGVSSFRYSTKESAEAVRLFPTIDLNYMRFVWLPIFYQEVIAMIGDLKGNFCSAQELSCGYIKLEVEEDGACIIVIVSNGADIHREFTLLQHIL